MTGNSQGINQEHPGEEVLKDIETRTRQAAREFLDASGMKAGQILVVGCSSSEIANSRIGSFSSKEIGETVYWTLARECEQRGIYLAAQCC